MAVASNSPGFIFSDDPRTGASTPEELKKRRAIAEALWARNAGAMPKDAAEGISLLGQALIHRVGMNSLAKEEAAGQEKTAAAGADLARGMGGFGAGDATASLAPASSSAAAPSPSDPSIFSSFIDTAKTGIQNPYGLAALAATGQAESGYDPKNAFGSWSDPSQSGQPGTAGGILSWRAERLEGLKKFAADNGDDPGKPSPSTQAKFFLQEDPNLIATLNGAKSIEEAQSAINGAWKFAGYDQPGGEAARRLGLAQGYLPKFQGGGTQVASLDPSAGMGAAGQPSGGDTPWLRYANQGATRSQPVSSELTGALGFLPELGVTAEVFSGGQSSAEEGGPRTGSTRHDHGGAADVRFMRDGRKLDWSNPDDVPIFQEIVRRGKAAGLTGFGAGDGYMEQGSMHVGFGNPGIWGAGGKGANAPDWLRQAYKGGGGPVAPAPSSAPVQVASLDPALGMEAAYAPQSAPAGAPNSASSAIMAALQQPAAPQGQPTPGGRSAAIGAALGIEAPRGMSPVAAALNQPAGVMPPNPLQPKTRAPGAPNARVPEAQPQAQTLMAALNGQPVPPMPPAQNVSANPVPPDAGLDPRTSPAMRQEMLSGNFDGLGFQNAAGSAPAAPAGLGLPAMPAAPGAAPASSMAPMQQGAPSPASPSGGIDERVLMSVLQNPWATDEQKQIAVGAIQEQRQSRLLAQRQSYDRRMQLDERAYERMTEAEKRVYEEGVRREGYGREDARFSVTDRNADRDFDFKVQQSNKPTDDVREFEYARNQGYTGSFLDFQLAQKKAAASSVSVSTGSDSSKLYDELDKNRAKSFNDMSDAGNAARRSLLQIDELDARLANVGTGGLAALKQFAGEWGIPVGDLSESQAASALINQLVPAQRPPGSGSMSDGDVAMFKASLPRIVNQPGGNQLIIQTLRGIASYDVQRGEIADRVADRELTPAQGRKLMAEIPNPLAEFRKANAQSAGAGSATPSQAVASPAPTAAPQRATNPQTGQTIEIRNGQWVPVQ